MKKKVLVADDHPLLREGIKKTLQTDPDLEVVGEAEDGEQAIRMARDLRPNIVLLDIDMPRVNGLEAARRLCTGSSRPWQVIILTEREEERYANDLLHIGVSGYLLKDITPSRLLDALRNVLRGEYCLAPCFEHKKGKLDKLAPPGFQPASITLREIEVLQLVGKGLSNYEIAQAMFLSEKTVKNHLTNIFKKLAVHDRTQALLYAFKNRLVPLP